MIGRRFARLAGTLLVLLLLGAGALVIYAAAALSRFERVEARRSTVLYASPPVLRARALQYVMEHKAIHIGEGELIVGGLAERCGGARELDLPQPRRAGAR